VNEKRTQVAISALGNPSETALEPARVLSGGEAEVAGEVSSGRETLDVSDEGK
jgi:hypothetical protein